MKNRLSLTALALLLAAVPLSQAGTMAVKIMTANFTSSNDYEYHAPAIRIIKGLHPDVVLVQEFNYLGDTAADYRAFVNTVFGPEYYYYYVEMRGSYYLPNGIISRWPIIQSGYWDDTKLTNREFAYAKIDLPGDAVLQVVSVHLDTDSAADRNAEAAALKNYVAANFNSGQFILVGGDLNTASTSEACLSTFNTFLNVASHRPADQAGNENTNKPTSTLTRKELYDWLMPNSVLDAYHTATVVSGHSFANGLVYDSRVTAPYSMLPSPILAPDSGVYGMQHMGVLKTFDIPVEPSRTPTPLPSPSPAPSPTPIPVILASGDYDGNGTSEIAVFRPSLGMWAIRGFTSLYFGASSDFPAAGDFDGDGTTDAAVFRPMAGLWSIRNITRTYFGSSADQPIPGDYDGDGRADIAVFRPSQSQWAIRDLTRWYFGNPTDRPAPGDYNGNGTFEIALFRKSAGMWAVYDLTRVYFGGGNDIPIPADYNGDGRTEVAIYRSYYGLWSVKDITRLYIGGSSYLPLPGDYDGNSSDEPGLFRPASGLWSIQGITRVYYGTAGDIPVTR